MEEMKATVSQEAEASSPAAYESIREELTTVPDASLVHINVDIPTAVATVLKSISGLQSLRSRVAELPEFNLAQFDKLETYTRAAFYANMLFNTASRPLESMPELLEEATTLRDMLYADAIALVHRGLLPNDELRTIKSATGYKPLAIDLISLAGVMRARWEKVKPRTGVHEEDLKQAELLADRIMNAVSQREVGPTSPLADAALNRSRAYTLFFRAYDSARRAVTYLRWEENDVDKVAPSLFSGRSAGQRRKSDSELTDVPAAPAEPAAPAPVGPTPGGAFIPPNLTDDAPPHSAIPIGMPGAPAFQRA